MLYLNIPQPLCKRLFTIFSVRICYRFIQPHPPHRAEHPPLPQQRDKVFGFHSRNFLPADSTTASASELCPTLRLFVFMRSGFEEAFEDCRDLCAGGLSLWLELVVGDAVQQSFGYCP